ncbi:9419_t:CDS:2 [Funneliformis caledonium]|uniref:9419_t:CDS:1 n=1 Tax=Funneliformis caledonium TaxID=1117310 RepID=A0A9N9IUN2_9GLOM|nr:9419_t:CDS:2 [Funneliformis caledonium]
MGLKEEIVVLNFDDDTAFIYFSNLPLYYKTHSILTNDIYEDFINRDNVSLKLISVNFSYRYKEYESSSKFDFFSLQSHKDLFQKMIESITDNDDNDDSIAKYNFDENRKEFR